MKKSTSKASKSHLGGVSSIRVPYIKAVDKPLKEFWNELVELHEKLLMEPLKQAMQKALEEVRQANSSVVCW